MRIETLGALALVLATTTACGGAEKETTSKAPPASPTSLQADATEPPARPAGAEVEFREVLAFERSGEPHYGQGVSLRLLDAFDQFGCGDRTPDFVVEIGVAFLCDAEGQPYIVGAPEMTTRVAAAEPSTSGQGKWSVTVTVDHEDADELALQFRFMDADGFPIALATDGEVAAAFDPTGQVAENGAFTIAGLTESSAKRIAQTLNAG